MFIYVIFYILWPLIITVLKNLLFLWPHQFCVLTLGFWYCGIFLFILTLLILLFICFLSFFAIFCFLVYLLFSWIFWSFFYNFIFTSSFLIFNIPYLPSDRLLIITNHFYLWYFILSYFLLYVTLFFWSQPESRWFISKRCSGFALM